jgi:acyl carrier protein
LLAGSHSTRRRQNIETPVETPMDRLTAIFQDVLDRPGLEIDGLSRSNSPEWDSLAHIKLILAIEEEFEIKFTIGQVAEIGSTAEIRGLLAARGVA